MINIFGEFASLSNKSIQRPRFAGSWIWDLVLLMIILVLAACVAKTDELNGIVVGTDGSAVQGALVTVKRNSDSELGSYITVFSDKNGQFSLPINGPVRNNYSAISVSKLGYETAHGVVSGHLKLKIEKVDNIAKSAPSSSWMGADIESEGKHLVNLHCSGCHQFPTDKVKGYAAKISDAVSMGAGGAEEKEKWNKLVRQEAWRSALKYMKAKAFTIFPDGSSINIEDMPWELLQSEVIALWTDQQGDIITEYLWKTFPQNTAYKSVKSYSYGAELGVNNNTVIREFELPKDSLVREAVMVKGSKYIWGADLKKNRLMRLDTITNQQDWFPVPYDGPTGPHTILGDDQGNVWLSMIENDKFARFKPDTNEWKLWSLTPKNLDQPGALSGQAAVHDISYGADGELQRDYKGRVWLTLIGLNMLAALDTDTGKLEAFPAPAVEGMGAITASLYGTILSSDGKCAWFTQLNGYFGCFNTETHETESLIKFPSGSGPRRMARDSNDIIWIPLYGSGEIVKYDGRARKILHTYTLPDRRSAPYAVAWDEARNALWITTSNADVIYRFFPEEERFSVYPLPRRQAYFRQLSIDSATGNLIGSYGNIPAGSGPSMAVIIQPGD